MNPSLLEGLPVLDIVIKSPGWVVKIKNVWLRILCFSRTPAPEPGLSGTANTAGKQEGFATSWGGHRAWQLLSIGSR